MPSKNKGDFQLKWPLKFKMITFTTLLILGIMVLTGVFFLIREKRLLEDKVRGESTTLVKTLSIPVTNVFLFREINLLNEEELLENYISQIMKGGWPIRYVVILDNDNRVLAHNDLKEFGKIYTDAITAKASASWEVITQTYSDSLWGSVLDASTPLAISSKRWGTLRVGFSLAPIQARIRSLYWEIIQLTLGIAFVAFLLVNFLSRKLITPLTILATEMEHTSVEKRHSPILVSSHDEIGYLAETFTEMRKRLIQSHNRLKQAQNQIIQAEKLASIGRLASGVAHEINNPLSGIQNCVRMILEEPENKIQTEQYLHLIDEGLSKIESVVQKLLNYARQEKLNQVEVDINASINKMLELIKYKVSKRDIEIDLILQNKLPMVLGDQHLIEQAILNLLINAFDAMPEGGTLTLRTSLKTTENQQGVLIDVEDTGVGIAESDQNKIFDPFFTTKDIGEGTGLGLSVCLGIIEIHKGEIKVQST